MSSELDICNMALSHIGSSVEIQNLTTEKSKEAQACRRFYAPARDETLRAFAWPKQKISEALALVETFDSDESDWGFSYQYPADAIMVLRLYTPGSGRRETEATRIPYGLGRDATRQLIFTDLEDAFVEYTFKETNPENFDPDFVSALSYLLAHKIGPRVAGGDQFKLSDRAYQYYRAAIAEARANSVNELQPDPEPDSIFMRARE
jgi:hypothetical protein